MKGSKISKRIGFIAAGVFSAILVAMAWPGLSYAQQTRTLILTGYKAVPKVQTPATGSIDITLKGDSLIVEGSFENLSSYYYGSAIFYGEKGEQGNKILSLNSSIAENRTSGRFDPSKNTFELTEGQLEALSKGNLYVAILSFDHIRGELRAQLPPLK